MIENKKKHNLQINVNNQVSKPSYLMTSNPDRFLQKSNRKQAMTIKDRDELNPEMAEIVRKILIKRKKEKKNNNNNNSMIKSRKVDSIKKYFDDNYNKKHGFNKEYYYKLNKSVIFDSLQDKMTNENNNNNYFEYMNKSTENNKQKNNKKGKINISFNYSNSRNQKNDSKNIGNIKENKNEANSSVKRRGNKDNLLSSSLNLEECEYDEFSPQSSQKIKIIKNNQYIVNLNSITIDVEQINKDKNLMEINCSTLEDNIINSKLLFLKESNNNDKKQNKKGTKDTIKNENSLENKMAKLNNNKKFIKNNKNCKLTLNKSTEHRNKSNINKNYYENNIFNNTMTNGFYPRINYNNSMNKKINNNEYKRNKLNLNVNKMSQKDICKDLLNTSVRRDARQKIKRELNYKNSNKAILKNNISNISGNNTNKKIYYPKNHSIKTKFSPSHSKNESSLSTERTLNNKVNSKIISNNINNKNQKRSKYAQNRSLSKDCFHTEGNQKYNISKTGKEQSQSYYETLKMNVSNKNNMTKSDFYKKKFIKKEENDAKKENNKENNKQKNNSLQHNNSCTKKEYPNMAKFLYERKIIGENQDEEQMQLSKNKETKLIKKIESLCKKGYSGPGVKKTNQDNFFIYNNFDNNSNYVYLGVCDGHGLFGQDISTYLVNNLPQNMNRNVMDRGIKNLSNENINSLSTIFQETFVLTNASLNEDERIDSSFSGSTCVTLLFTPTRICCVNVGDSRCILGKYNGYEWSAKALSRDHKPSDPDEMDRIFKSGGRVESYRDNFGNFVGPERVWNKEMDGPGLAMSRSFGDEIGHKIGVVVDPEIMEHYFLKEDKFIILGSDGIWEFISNNEVVDIVKNYYLDNNIEGAIEHLYNEASKRWIMEEEVIDDITVIVIFLN